MKKLLSLILALMLCALPVLSMAEGGVIGGADGPTDVILSGPAFILPGDLAQPALEAGRKGVTTVTVTEVSGISTGDADLDTALTDLIKALGVSTSVQGDETEFSFTISGNDVLNLGLMRSGDDVYVKSNLLGGTLVVGSDEAELLLERLLDMLVLMEGITAEDAEMLKAEIDGMGSVFGAALQNEAFNVNLTDEDLLALDFSAFTAVLEQILQKAEPMENPVVPRSCDPAVSGLRVSVTNEDMIAVCRALIQCVQSNPRLMNFIAAQFELNTNAQLTALWDVMKEYGVYESEEDFMAYNISLESVLEETLAQLEGSRLLDGDYVIQMCYDEAGMPVYATFTLPLFMEVESLYTAGDSEIIASPSADMIAEIKPQGETMLVEAVYARQTVAQGVSHVVNFSVDDQTLTVDTLVNGNTAHIVLSVPEEAPVIIDAAVEGNRLTAALTYCPDEETSIACNFEGSYLYTEAEYVLTGRFVLTEVYTPGEVETPSINGMTLPGFEAHKPKARTNTFVIDIAADYDLNGVDFSGVTEMVIEYNDVHIALQAASCSGDPSDSIMSGAVVRPAELDEAAFANWFVGVINTINSWSGNLMMALPESLLTMMMYSGM